MALASSISSEEYLYGICHRLFDGACPDQYEIWRWKLGGSPGGGARLEKPVSILTEPGRLLDMSAFVLIGSKIYMIGFGPDSTRILVLESKNFHTYDLDQIVTEAPNPALASVRYRNAVAIGGKIYTFPQHFGPARCTVPLAESRFQVFDPATLTTKSLPEPPVGYESAESFLVIKSHILLCLSARGRQIFLAWDTANESISGGWRDVTYEFLTYSAPNPSVVGPCSRPCPCPFVPTRLDNLCATTLGGSDDDDGSMRFFVTTGSRRHPLGFAIVEFGDDPIRIKKWYRVLGLPKSLVGRSCFTDGGNVFFTFTYDDRPEAAYTTWEFLQFSLSYVPGGVHECYVAKPVLPLQLLRPVFNILRASFVIPASI